MTCRAQHLGRYLKGQGHSMTLQQNHVRPITLLFEVRFRYNYMYTVMITILRRHVVRNIWAATLKVKVTAWPSAKSCPAHNFVIWSQILQLFYIIDPHIDTTCRAQHLGRCLKGQGHSMTFQHNCVLRLPITSLFEVLFKNYFTEIITMLRRCVAHNIWVATLKVKVTVWPFSKIDSCP